MSYLEGQPVFLLQIGEQRFLQTVPDVFERLGVGEDAEAALRREVGSAEGILRQADVAVDNPIVEAVQSVVYLVLVLVAQTSNLRSQLVRQSVDAEQDETEPTGAVVSAAQQPLTVPVPRRRPVCLDRYEPLDDRVHAVGMSRAVLPDGAVDEAQVLQQQQPALVVQPVQRFVARIFLQLFGYLADVVLGDGARRSDALELVEQVSVLQQQFLQKENSNQIRTQFFHNFTVWKTADFGFFFKRRIHFCHQLSSI